MNLWQPQKQHCGDWLQLPVAAVLEHSWASSGGQPIFNLILGLVPAPRLSPSAGLDEVLKFAPEIAAIAPRIQQGVPPPAHYGVVILKRGLVVRAVGLAREENACVLQDPAHRWLERQQHEERRSVATFAAFLLQDLGKVTKP